MFATRVQQGVPSLKLSKNAADRSPQDAEFRLAAQLMHLASQFHRSEYCRTKFGAQGEFEAAISSTLTYVPLSIHLPDHFKQPLIRQAIASQCEPWLLSGRDDVGKVPPATAASTPASLGPPPSDCARFVKVMRASPTLQNDIVSAIETPLGPPSSPPAFILADPLLKTSETHPLNISTLIPPELLTTLSLHLSVGSPSSPTLFSVHPAFSLERIALPLPPSHAPPSYASVFPPPVTSSEPKPSSPALQLWSRAPLKHALQNALAGTIRRAPHNAPPKSPRPFRPEFSRQSSPPPPPPTQVPNVPSLPPLAIDKFDLLGEILARVNAADEMSRGGRNRHGHDRTFSAPPTVFKALLAERPTALPKAQLRPAPTAQWEVSIMHRGGAKPSKLAGRPDLGVQPSSFAPPTLGNLFLSSCPGKKVRLDAPVSGRVSVCRDLTQDLVRIKSLGVGCIVCCLDDDELEFLGVPWDSYAAAARAQGLDVLRVPMPEGLSPRSPAAFDALLCRLLERYTLAGTHVLVHCRGGVGRAGLVACCWALRLGLCGWPMTPKARRRGSDYVGGEVPADTLALVQRVIEVVRRRRSLKAVETYEQVRFLVDYVEYMRTRVSGQTDLE